MKQLLGQLHFELVYLYGHRETVLGRFETCAEALAERTIRAAEFTWLGGRYIVRARDY